MYRIFLKLLIVFVVVGLTFTSCVPKKKMVYLQSQSTSSDSVFLYEREIYHLQVSDIVDVKIISLDEKVNEIFNANAAGTSSQVAQVANLGDLYYVTGYSIDQNGNIYLPIIGEVKIVGLSLEKAKEEISAKAERFFSKYFLSVRIGGIRFSALGEFARPGKYTILQNQATIFEAIALAGDLLMVASRSDVKLIRQYPEGTKMHTINLLDKNLINTPFYFIQPNDVIYVEPLKSKSWGVGVNAAQSTALILSLVSSTLLIIVSFRNL